MRLTVLGFQSPYPGPGGATAGYLLQTDLVNILIDCGSGVISQLTKLVPAFELDALLLSHYHHDHVADLGVLQYGLMAHQSMGDRAKDAPLAVYAPAETQNQAVGITYKSATMHHVIDENDEIVIGDVVVRFFCTDHPVECYGMRIEHNGKTIIYGADTGPNVKWPSYAKGADLFICEGTYLESNKPADLSVMGHMTVGLAAEAAEQLEAKEFWITHLWPAYTEERVLAEAKAYRSGTCRVAQIGLSKEF
ncbi:MBL fold metallo-hydrolase [Brevibacillus dissolubilis]|uniref:MBL fold metallo-hydrolase n=1 Tax=Brevibacillus dissolubilis TaxID=1844116 RepID=UPI001116577E|nr:MBL fold metallo-hydrolase [Brevibacillus dissolubilis]